MAISAKTPSTNGRRQWSQTKVSLQRRWLRLMKRMVSRVDGSSRLGLIQLHVLSRLPSGWTALVALSKSAQEGDKVRSITQAERAIRMNPAVWQGHVRRAEALEQSGKQGEALVARMAGILLMAPSSLVQACGRWFDGIDGSDWEAAARACGDVPIELVARDIVRFGGAQRRLWSLERLAQLPGASRISNAPGIEKELPEADAIALARSLRVSGHITAPLELLRKYPSSPAINGALTGAEQDAAALNKQINIKFPFLGSYRPRSRTSIYLLHNSLPYSSGGYANRTHGLITAMQALGREVIPITRPGFPSKKYVFDQMQGVPAFDQVDSVRYHRIRGTVVHQPRTDLQGFIDTYTRAVEPIIGEYRPGIVHAASNWWNGFAAIAAAGSHGLPSVYEIRGLWEVTKASRVAGWASTERYAADGNYEAEAASQADRVIVITYALRDEMIRRGVNSDKIIVVPNGVDVSRFATRAYDAPLAQQLGIKEEVVVGFAGSLTFYEGLGDLLRAGARIRHETSTPFRFLFVGDGPVEADLKALAGELGLVDICDFVGRVPHSDVVRYLSLMSITPFPRKPLPVCEMVSPLKPLESMASGAVVLASNVQALAEMVPSDTGLLFEKDNLADLASNLARLIDDAELRKVLASNARTWVEENRTWTKVSADIVRLYEELQSGPHRPVRS